jgi:hypothetical protein
MARLGVFLLLFGGLLMAGEAKSLWSGGVEWATASTPRAAAFWQDDGAVPTGRPFPDVAIGGQLYTSQLQSADWTLGISDFLADLAPNTASLTFAGEVSGVPGDDVVISSQVGVQWAGRLDTLTVRRDTAGDKWTTITATDRIGALGEAQLVSESSSTGFLDDILEALALESGVTLDIEDASRIALPVISSFGSFSENFDGSVLAYMNNAARTGNTMLALQRDGAIAAVMREERLGGDINGDFEVDTTGWSAYVGGGISRTTTTPLSGVAEGRVACTTTQYSGCVYPITGTFRAGRTYRLSVYTELISGENAWYIQLYSASDPVSAPFTQFTATSTPTTRTVDYTPSVDVDDMEVYVGAIDAVPTVGVLAIDDVTVYDGGIDLTGYIRSWDELTSIDVDINWWQLYQPGGGSVYDDGDAADVAIYGKRVYSVDQYLSSNTAAFSDWINYGGSQRPTASGELVVDSWSDEEIILLNPFQWVIEEDTAWQVMSVKHSVSASPFSWTVSITADNLLDLL